MSEEGTSFFREAAQPSNLFLLRLAAIAARGFGLIALAVFTLHVPETKGRSLEEIETELVDD